MPFDILDARIRRTLLEAGARALSESTVPHPRRTARWLLEGILQESAAAVLAGMDAEVTAEDARSFGAAIRRCQRHEPLQYVLGYADFCGLPLRVTPAVLIPRPETELVVQAALERMSASFRPRVLDLGTGSGCIALALKQARPDAHVTACDISRAALRVAGHNVRRIGLAVALIHADMVTDADRLAARGPFDVIVSNPPYVPDAELPRLPPNVRHYEPRVALACGEDPLYYYRAIAVRHDWLRPGGHLVLEVHAEYGDRVKRLLTARGYTHAAVLPDLAGLPRIAVASRAAD